MWLTLPSSSTVYHHAPGRPNLRPTTSDSRGPVKRWRTRQRRKSHIPYIRGGPSIPQRLSRVRCVSSDNWIILLGIPPRVGLPSQRPFDSDKKTHDLVTGFSRSPRTFLFLLFNIREELYPYWLRTLTSDMITLWNLEPWTVGTCISMYFHPPQLTCQFCHVTPSRTDGMEMKKRSTSSSAPSIHGFAIQTR